jgi:protein phosphatase
MGAPSAWSESPSVVFASLTDVGRVRKNNEDAVGDPKVLAALVGSPARLASRGTLLAVADGMGGHALGEVASHAAVEALFRYYYAADGSPPDDFRLAVQAAKDAVRLANARREEAASTKGQAGMGTTLVVALVGGTTLQIANVGDSRAYRLHAGDLSLLTVDHSLVAEQVRAGMISADDARTYPLRNVLTRAIGGGPDTLVDFFLAPWLPGDRLLLCSDGLRVLLDDLIRDALLGREPEDAVRWLVDAANERGAPDNVSVIVAAREGL